MAVEDAMKEHGFRISASCAGTAWYTKFLEYKGKRAYITVTDQGGEELPQTLEEPVQVTIYELRSGDELEEAQRISSLDSYLKSLE
jgi:hypothetical protein